MEARFKSLSVFEFQQRFPDDDSCMRYLSELKWSKGFKCRKCGNGKWCSVSREHSRECTKCRYVESPTSGTLFHKVKFSLLKAFWIVYYVSTTKKGVASTELSRKLELRQKTCWLFKQKVMQAMESSGKHPLEGDVEVDEFVIGQQEEGVRGRKNKSKKLVIIAIEKSQKGVKRLYARHIKKTDKQTVGSFLEERVSKSAIIKSDAFSTYRSLTAEMPNLKPEKSERKGKNFKTMHRVIMGLKSWLRGIHGHAELLQHYLDEYCYRYNRHLMKEGIFENLITRMVEHPPRTYKMIVN